MWSYSSLSSQQFYFIITVSALECCSGVVMRSMPASDLNCGLTLAVQLAESCAPRLVTTRQPGGNSSTTPVRERSHHRPLRPRHRFGRGPRGRCLTSAMQCSVLLWAKTDVWISIITDHLIISSYLCADFRTPWLFSRQNPICICICE